jgi:peroxiredoxin
MSGTQLAVFAAAVAGVTGTLWLRLMMKGRIPKDLTAFLAANVAAALLGVAALLLGTNLAGAIASGLAIFSGSIFVALYAASGQERKTPAVAVGGRVLDFTATDDEGQPFAVSNLRGRPFLLKFFRGHWCPYCVAELRRWLELLPALEARGIEIVAVCADTAEEIRAGRAKHGLPAVMIPDPDLALTDRFNLRNPKNFAPRPGIIIPLPIPTTILVDANGTVRWIDQSTDYLRRSDPEYVLQAIRAALDVPNAAASNAA